MQSASVQRILSRHHRELLGGREVFLPGEQEVPTSGLPSPTAYCEWLGNVAVGTAHPEERKNQGQYFTPPEVAKFMAQLTDGTGSVSVLDAGSGTGILSCALIESLASSKKVQHIHIDAYEEHEFLASLSEKALEYTRAFFKHQVRISFRVIPKDFIRACSHSVQNPQLFQEKGNMLYDIAISNPPYFKLPKSDPRVYSLTSVVHGQPNIYAFFMAISASLLKPKGQLIFITPRSFASGPYFQAFREQFFKDLAPVHIHLFESRKEAFKKDAVLQENIILKAVKKHGSGNGNGFVRVSSSKGTADILASKSHKVPRERIIRPESKHCVLHIPSSPLEDSVQETVESWPSRLSTFGLQISTGPVVSFRATQFLLPAAEARKKDVAPLLWMHHVRAMSVKWPVPNAKTKPQAIKISRESSKLLLPTKTYVLLRRFSAKEEPRRLIAGVATPEQFRSPHIGLENHLNYIHRPNGAISLELAHGLAALLNSSLLDRYFRILNGNTQVSATEIRDLPLPTEKDLTKIGREIIPVKDRINVDQLDKFVGKVLKLPMTLIEKLARKYNGKN